MMPVCAPGALAQSVTGTIVGTVLDAQGAAVPSATVTARDRDTGLARSAMSEAAGEFPSPVSRRDLMT